MQTVAIIAAAGKGIRMGGEVPKILMPIGQQPLLAHTLWAFEQAHRVDHVILVTAEHLLDQVAEKVVEAHGLRKVIKLIPGGMTRQESVYAGLQATDAGCQLVAIHDGARPLITTELIDLTVEQAAQHEAVAVAVRPTDTIRRGEDDVFQITLDRDKLWMMQTPQAFSRDLIVSAHRSAAERGYRGTDDASLVEAMGHRVFVVQGRYDNIKVTTPEDLIFAEMVLERRRGG